ncbi:hypothetical protein COV19_01985 [Candidatus Woesearchaeota archaeon CG10_big_fil_rev_8_21_14_0_10_44_13]|nr:MAG: hypothetical protein COV19_01985 [Candidatus Woesearchaeota archaeon CG10_big_fil_rev_8_21_14_0_10_44_13]
MDMRQEHALKQTLVERLEACQVIDTFIDRYRLFLTTTGDLNPPHLDPDYAKNTFFKGPIVPGLFLGLMAEGNGAIPRHAVGIDLRFHEAVMSGKGVKVLADGDEILPKKEVGWYVSSQDSSQEPRPVITGKISMNPDLTENPKIITECVAEKEKIRVYSGKVREDDIRNMIAVAGMIGESETALKMHAAGYVSPALLMFGREGVTGAYTSQSFIFHNPLRPDDEFMVIAKKAREKTYRGQNFATISYSMVRSDEKPVVTGTAMVVEVRYGNA